MKNNAIFIPKRINVGFQTRKDTYTQKLAYVIYWDEKGKLRKEASWSSWRDNKIEPEAYDNIPTEGFVLNKHVGGYKMDWNFRQSYVRVYDPRGFEFEITIPNLLYILENTSSIKGKGLEGEFVYGWSGTELVLLPTNSPEYIQLAEFAQKRFTSKKLTAKDLKPGFKYRTKSNKEFIYLGHFDGYQDVYKFDNKQFLSASMLEKYARENGKPLNNDQGLYSHRYSVYGTKTQYYTYEPGCIGKQYFFLESGTPFFKMMKSVSGKFIEETSDEPDPRYSEFMEKLEHDTMFSPIDRSKDEIIREEDIQACIDRFNAVYPKALHSVKFLTIINDKIEEYEIISPINADPNTWICRFTYHSSHGSSSKAMEKFFPFQDSKRYNSYCSEREMIPITLKQIFKTLPPVYINQYLKNGKFYRRLTTHDQ